MIGEGLDVRAVGRIRRVSRQTQQEIRIGVAGKRAGKSVFAEIIAGEEAQIILEFQLLLILLDWLIL